MNRSEHMARRRAIPSLDRQQVESDLVALGMPSGAIARARDLDGQFADAFELHRKLVEHRSQLAIRLLHAERQLAAAHTGSDEFSARRVRNRIAGITEEIEDTEALLDETERVFRRLRRETRVVADRLAQCELVAATLPPSGERTRLHLLIDEIRGTLVSIDDESVDDSGLQSRRDEAVRTGQIVLRTGVSV